MCIVDATDHPMHKSLPLGTWHKAFRRIILIHLANGCGQNPSPLTTTCIFNITSYSLLPLPKQPPHGVLPDSLSTSGLFMTLSFTVALVSLTKSLVFFLFNMQLFVLSFVFATVLGSWVCTSTESVVSILFLSFCKKGFYLFISRERGREKERERNINVWLPLAHPYPGTWPATQACSLIGKWTHDPLVCRLALSPARYTSQGLFLSFTFTKGAESVA